MIQINAFLLQKCHHGLVIHDLVVEEVFGLGGAIDLAGDCKLGPWDHCVEISVVLLVENLLEGDPD